MACKDRQTTINEFQEPQYSRNENQLDEREVQNLSPPVGRKYIIMQFLKEIELFGPVQDLCRSSRRLGGDFIVKRL